MRKGIYCELLLDKKVYMSQVDAPYKPAQAKLNILTEARMEPSAWK